MWLLYAMHIGLGMIFKEPFYNALNDEDLLFNNDPHFVPYWQDEETYDAILDKMEWNESKGMVPDIYQYYKEEMLIGQL